MNDMFMSHFGAAYPITISVIERVPDHRNARQVTSDHELKAALDTRMSRGRGVRRCIRSAPSLFSPKDLASRSCIGKSSQVGSMLRCDCCRLEGETNMVEHQGGFAWYELMTTDMGRAGRVGAGSGLHLVYRRRRLDKRAHGSTGGRAENGRDAKVDGVCRRQR